MWVDAYLFGVVWGTRLLLTNGVVFYEIRCSEIYGGIICLMRHTDDDCCATSAS